MVVPEQVSVALNEIAADVREGPLALAVGAGLQVMFTDSVAQLCGAKRKHDQERVGYRHGTEGGPVTLGDRRVPVQRQRVRATDSSGELALPAYELFSSTEVLGQMAMARMPG